jgi:hypothetical protein
VFSGDDVGTMQKTFTKEVAIGAHTAHMTMDPSGKFACSWSPEFPREGLTKNELMTYENAVAALGAEAMGQPPGQIENGGVQ